MSTIYPTNGTTYSISTTGTSLGSFTTTSGVIYTTPTFTTFATSIEPDWKTGGGCTTTLFQDYSALASQWQAPEHFFEEGSDGCCSLCESQNVHRFSELTHPLVINEEPDADDWWQLLAS